MQFNRREFVSLAAAGTLAPLAAAHAQAAYPSKPITLVVPFTPGGSVDNSGRLMADRLSRELGVPVVVDNKGGAGGTMGSVHVAKARPDGYTLVVTSQSTHVVNPAVNPNLPYDAVKDFAPITLIDRLANVLLVNADLPVRSFAELVKYAQANPGKLNYASAGTGSVSHLSMELLKTQAKLPMTHIPYRGAGVAVTDLIAGQVQLTWNNLSSNLGNIRNGKLRALAVAAPQRVPQLPDVPTFAELKLPDLNLTSWTGLAAPANTPPAIIERLYQATRKVLQDPATQATWVEKGMMVPEDVTPQAYRAEIAERIKFYQRIAKANNIVLE
ncbi:Bug family tripartite tricarboxylate transporter substrate binding protein [Comamonas endophytica]|uniref:Tripartite tricarboxylate transporter substrate binding protein n=1 Tax=Comamonas endophytica TaxID=2949090 RepID=A0ABY6G7D9_9BURK|nr:MULTISPECIES: tripartite tricarboxylate transporter substrate binding protein [unclassified Acidovorax]MCD2511437.1 tripartite tricarboxylate transporter substrate binding protein [Acidovorax sp. D4N7]UYG50828.1 tripartite tricarboxylate transporter substrate binding protein [Acidovorax sp. 5MLIR]